MKRAELVEGMVVYRAAPYEWRAVEENVDHARAVVRSVQPYAWSEADRGWLPRKAGTLVKLEMPSLGNGRERVEYHPLGHLRGLYDEIAPQRRELQRGIRAEREARISSEAQARVRRNALIDTANNLIGPSLRIDPGLRVHHVEMTLDALAALLAAAGATILEGE